jgi:methyl-accepting chemotaxis protein
MAKNFNILRRVKSVGMRISLTAGFLILLSTLTGYVALQASASYRTDAEFVTNLADRTIDVFDADLLLYKLVRAEKDYVLTGEASFKNERISFSDRFDEALEGLLEDALTQESLASLKAIQQQKIEYDQNFLLAVNIYESADVASGGFEKVLVPSTEEGGEDTVVEVFVEGTKVGDAFEQVRELSLINTDILLSAEEKHISKVVEFNKQAISERLAAAVNRSEQIRLISMASILVAVFIGLLVAFVVVRSITAALRSIIERLVRLTAVLTDSVSQATEVADRNSATSQQLATATTQQAKQAEAISTTINQTAAAITQSAQLAQEGTTSATRANELSQEGGQGAEQAVKSLQNIGNIVEGAVERIRTLAESSREVGELATEVTSIADQTNILALNAAIEAARAGEAGRGFAVVADEVRRLAESSRNFADQITKLISSVVLRAQETASSTAEGAKEVTNSASTISQSLSAFQEISKAVSEANTKIQEIATSISQQAQSAEQISKTTASIAQGIDQNAAAAGGLADAAGQQKVVISVIEKSLEEAQLILTESQSLVGIRNTKELLALSENTGDENFAPEAQAPSQATGTGDTMLGEFLGANDEEEKN